MAVELSPTDLVDAVGDVLTSVLALGRELTEADAGRPTDCPGWTVQDQFAHIVGLGQLLEGAPPPEVELPGLDHVTSDLDRFMEGPIHVRRPLPLVAVVDELAGYIPRRLASLRALAAEDGDPAMNSPFGDQRPFSKTMPTHVLDIWSHEQDIRRAIGREARTDCAAGRLCLGQTLRAWSALLPRKVEGVDAEVTVTVEGEEADDRTTITLGSGGSTITVSGSVAALTRVGFGRGPLGTRLADLTIGGDPATIDAIVPHLAFTP